MQLVKLIDTFDSKLENFNIKLPFNKYQKLLWFQVAIFVISVQATGIAICVVIHPIGHPFMTQLRCLLGICIVPIIFNFINIFHFLNLIFLTKKFYQEVHRFMKTAIKKRRLHLLIGSISDLYCNLTEISRKLSTNFERFLLISISCIFIMAIIFMYTIFVFIIGTLRLNTFQFLSVMSWTCLQLLLVFAYVQGCEGFKKEIFRSTRILWHFDPRKIGTLKVLILFQLQHIQSIPEFSAGKLFNVDYKLIMMFLGATVSYLIIVIQFHLQN